MIDFFRRLLSNNPEFQTFTYYIPGPPARKTGYREKQFDKIVSELSAKNITIESIHTQAHNGASQSGMWVILKLKSIDPQVKLADLDFTFMDQILEGDQPSLPLNKTDDEEMEIYQIDNP